MQENDNSASLEELYIKERKKSQIFMSATAVLAILLVGSVLYFQTNDSTTQVATVGSPEYVEGSRQGGGFVVADYFYANGDLNKTALNERLSFMPQERRDQFASRMLDSVERAVDDGEITRYQAAELIDYLNGMSAESESI